MNRPQVVAVSRKATHGVDKSNCPVIRLIAGEGVEGDFHRGVTVRHRSRRRQDPTQPNLRQVHLIHAELHVDLAAQGFALRPGLMGENITTEGIDLLALPERTVLTLGHSARIEITGLRNPCAQIERYRPGLLQAVLGLDAAGEVVRKSGVMAIVLAGGEVHPGDSIAIHLPAGPHRALQVV